MRQYTLLLGLMACQTTAEPCEFVDCRDKCVALTSSVPVQLDFGPSIPPEGQNNHLAPHEYDILKEDIALLRTGIRPASERGIGVCNRPRACSTFLGSEVEELPPGSWGIRVALEVPPQLPAGNDNVFTRLTCTQFTPNAQGKLVASQTVERNQHRLEANGSFRPEVIVLKDQIVSPSSTGPLECSWEVKLVNPRSTDVYTGGVKVPAVERVVAPDRRPKPVAGEARAADAPPENAVTPLSPRVGGEAPPPEPEPSSPRPEDLAEGTDDL
ncbi:MAG: hypothetical protein ACON4N_01170 [Myxococcota bacterium]